MLDYRKKENKYCSTCLNAKHENKHIHVCQLGSERYTECLLNDRSKWLNEEFEEFIEEQEMRL